MASLKWPETISILKSRQLDLQISKLAEMKWFISPETQSKRAKAEKAILEYLTLIGTGNLSICWLNEQETADFIHSYELVQDPIWPQLYEIPDKINQAAKANNAQVALSFIANEVPEHLFHSIYDGAFHAFERQGEKVISHAVASALYITSLYTSWDVICDEEPNPLAMLYEVLSSGYLPLGIKEGIFHVY